MKGLLRLLIPLYPSPWRQRYESEFRALLEDVNPNWRSVADVIKGGVTMRLKMLADWKIVAITAVIGLLGGILVSYETLDKYVSSAIIKVHSAGPSDKRFGALLKTALTDETLIEIVAQNNLYPDLRAKAPLARVITEINKDIRIAPAKFTSADQSQSGIVVQFIYYDRPLSQRICSQLVGKIMHAASEAAWGSKATLELSAAPDLPNGPFHPNRLNLLIVGVLWGTVAGLTFAWLRRRSHHSV